MNKSLFVTALLTATLATSAQAQVDHLQCHKVKDTIKFKGTVVDLVAIQAQFQLPEDCKIIGKATELCVPVSKTVVDQGTAPGSLIGPGNDLTPNDYICYKMKCPKVAFPDTFATDQFGGRNLQKIKTAVKLCVPAVEGVVATTTSTLPPPTTSSTSTLPPATTTSTTMLPASTTSTSTLPPPTTTSTSTLPPPTTTSTTLLPATTTSTSTLPPPTTTSTTM
jgi:hypothetical protein